MNKIIVLALFSLSISNLFCSSEQTIKNPGDKVVGAVLALRKKLTPNVPIDVILRLADYILHDTKNYTRHERLKIAFELLHDPYFKNYQQALIKHLYADQELAPRLPNQSSPEFLRETPLILAHQFGYTNPTDPNNLKSLLEPHDPLTLWELRHAIQARDSEKIQKILDNFDVTTVDALGESTLFYAVENKNVDLIKELLAKKANPNLKDISGRTPLIAAIVFYSSDKEQFKKIIKELLDHGANPNVWVGLTPLIWASKRNDLEIVEMLLHAGADVRWKSPQGITALSNANLNNPDVIITLIKAGADVNDVDRMGYTIFSRAIMGKLLLNINTGNLLQKLYPYFDKLSQENKEQALIAALAVQDNTTVETLLIKGVNPNFVLSHDKAITKLLEKSGISNQNNVTPLMLAAAMGNTKALGNKELLKTLLSHGADPLATDENGKTARDYINERLPNVRIFLQNAADYALSKKFKK